MRRFIDRSAEFVFKRTALAASLLLATACGDDGEGDAARERVVEGYVALVRASYDESIATARSLRDALNALVTTPSEATMTSARNAWLAARRPYGQTEVYRFYEGPIDNEQDGPEGLINGWPLDESFIDYIAEDPNTGMINHPELYATVSEDLLLMQNENGSEENIASGYHAIEFLLWGQDLSATAAGARPHTDYVASAQGPGRNAQRRGQYLLAAADLLLESLESVRAAWADGAPYLTTFRADPNTALANMIRGMSELASTELAGERMQMGFEMQSQELEHSCFSDNTPIDFEMNALGIENVYLGRYGALDGRGLEDLVAGADAALDAEFKQRMADVKTAFAAIPKPYDQALLSETGRPAIAAAIQQLYGLNESIVKLPTALDLGQ